MEEKVIIYYPKFGYASGEMPHFRYPPKNYVLPQVLFYLYTAVKNIGCNVIVIDGNFTKDTVTRILEFNPGKILISSTTPSFGDTIYLIHTLQQKGYIGDFYVGGPHVSLNLEYRDFLLPKIPGVTYISCREMVSGFEWVPHVFPGKSQLNVLGMEEKAAEEFLLEKIDVIKHLNNKKKYLDSYLFQFFVPSTEWIENTYRGQHIYPEKTGIKLRYSILTSIGCTQECNFCSNPYIYSIGYKNPNSIMQILDDPCMDNHLSVSDMFFLMQKKHAAEMVNLFKQKEYSFSIQTCLFNLTNSDLDNLKKAGVKNILVGIENPLLSSIGKEVKIDKIEWLMSETKKRKIGLKLSYIVGLRKSEIIADIKLLLHILLDIIQKYNLSSENIQVNLNAPYRPEPDIVYLPFESGVKYRSDTVYMLTKLPFHYWGILPIAFYDLEHFRIQVSLCDLLYHLIYPNFKEKYLEIKKIFRQEVITEYPVLEEFFPEIEESIHFYDNTISSCLEKGDVAFLSSN